MQHYIHILRPSCACDGKTHRTSRIKHTIRLFFFTAGVVRLPHVKSMLAARPLTNNYSIRFRLIVALETNRVARTQDMAQWPPYKVVGDAALHKPLSRYACCSTYCTFQCPNRFHRCSHLRWSGPKEFSPADLP